MRIKVLSFLFHTQKSTKSTKSIKITKTQISEQATFLTLDVFYAHKNAVFFVFVRLHAFCAFCVCKIFLYKKKLKRFKIALIPSFTILLTCTPLTCLNLKSYLYALIFIYHLWGSFLFMGISSYL